MASGAAPVGTWEAPTVGQNLQSSPMVRKVCKIRPGAFSALSTDMRGGSWRPGVSDGSNGRGRGDDEDRGEPTPLDVGDGHVRVERAAGGGSRDSGAAAARTGEARGSVCAEGLWSVGRLGATLLAFLALPACVDQLGTVEVYGGQGRVESQPLTVTPAVALSDEEIAILTVGVWAESSNATHSSEAIRMMTWVFLNKKAMDHPGVDMFTVINGSAKAWDTLTGAFGAPPSGPEGKRGWILGIHDWYMTHDTSLTPRYQGLHGTTRGEVGAWLASGTGSSADPTRASRFFSHQSSLVDQPTIEARFQWIRDNFAAKAAEDSSFSYALSEPYTWGGRLMMTVTGSQGCAAYGNCQPSSGPVTSTPVADGGAAPPPPPQDAGMAPPPPHDAGQPVIRHDAGAPPPPRDAGGPPPPPPGDGTCTEYPSGNNGDSCSGVAEETWRCACHASYGDISQVCRGGVWLTRTTSPSDCGSCGPGSTAGCLP